MIEDALDLLVPDPPARGDWGDVLHRAGVDRHPAPAPAPAAAASRRRVSVIAAALALVVAIALLATPAFGLQGLVLDLFRKDVPFSKSEPAPNVVKKQFADLGLGAPPRFASEVDPDRAREVGRFRIRGRLRAIWVAPVRHGGFCYTLEELGGGCLPRESERRPLTASWGFSQRRGEQARTTFVEGVVTGARAARLELVYRDGTRTPVPFVYVSKPIAAGFFDVQTRQQVALERPEEIVLSDEHGRVLAREHVPSEGRPLLLPLGGDARPRKPRALPTTGAPPSAPLQRASAQGASVVAGANGSVVFHIGRLDPARKSVLRRSVGYGCFRLTREYGIFDARGSGSEGRVQPTVALLLSGVGSPLDGCELSSETGHRWPDRFGSHGPVELPITAAGRRYFADRAAARDLALLVRSARVQRIRKELGPRLERDLRAAYPSLGRIRYRLTPTGVVFSERSTTGKRFTIIVSHRRIVRQNLEPYALVF